MDKESFVRQLQSYLEPAINPKNAVPMKKYMKNHFEYLGIKSPERKVILSNFIMENGLPEPELIRPIIKALWQLPEREYHYCAMVHDK